MWPAIGLEERPLHAGREAGPAATAQARVLDELDDRCRIHLQRALEAAIAATLLPAVERGGCRIAEMLRQDRRLTLVHWMRIAHLGQPSQYLRYTLRRNRLDEPLIDHDRRCEPAGTQALDLDHGKSPILGGDAKLLAAGVAKEGAGDIFGPADITGRCRTYLYEVPTHR